MNVPKIAARLARPPLWGTLAACAAILVWRRPDQVRLPQFWAEDGPVFFMHAHLMGGTSLLEPSAGYLHTVLRLVAWLATWFDASLAPVAYMAASAALTLYVAARTQSLRCPLPSSCGYAFAVVLVPDAFEVLLNLTNLQWILAGGLMLLLIAKDPTTTVQRVHDAAGTVLLGLTGPFVIVLLPLFVWRAWQRRTQFSVLLALLAAGCAIVQLRLILTGPNAAQNEALALESALAIPGVRVGASLLTGGRLGPEIGLAIATALGVATLGGIAWLAGRRGAARIERTWLGLAFGGLLAVSLYRCRHAFPVLFEGGGSRYFFPLQLIALWLVIAAAADSPRRAARMAGAVLACMAVFNLPRLREPAFADLNWVDSAAKIRRGERVTVRINPEPWEFTLPGRTSGENR